MKNDDQAVFLTAGYAIESEGGGVQRCSREYADVLSAAGYKFEYARYEFDRRPLTRVRRKFFPEPYKNLIHPSTVAATAELVRKSGARWLFFNQIEAAPLAAPLSFLRTEGVRFVLLSHGVDSSDQLHTYRIDTPRSLQHTRRRDALWLGRQVFAEMQQHQYFDEVFCLSDTDRLFEQWLGGRSVHVLPRVCRARPINWNPVAGRLGFIGTLVHAPNREGLELLAEQLRESAERNHSLRLRVIGRPIETGRELAKKYPFVDYLGGLTDAEFEQEAASWCAFANPIFCYARGCSTKLAVPLEWHLPLTTSRAGARGYVWDEALIPLMESPQELARDAVALAHLPAATERRKAVAALCAKSPTLEQHGSLVRRILAEHLLS